MSTPRHIHKSMHSANAVVNKLRPPACFVPPSFLLPAQARIAAGRLSSRRRASSSSRRVSTEELRSSFVGALVQVASHRHCSARRAVPRSARNSSSTALQKNERKDDLQTAQKTRPAPRYTAEEYLSLMDFYDDHPNTLPEPKKNPLSWSEGQIPPEDIGEHSEDEVYRAISVLDKLLGDADSSPEDVFKAYQRLPEPGVKFLDKGQRIYLVRKLSVTEYKSSTRTMAFLSLLDDYRKAGLPIPRHAWNSAMSLGSTTLPQITEAEVEFALQTWKEMEFQAGIRGCEVTFNILFDVASKAGKFSLAEMILQEMDARGLDFTRFTRVGLILYFGLRKDGDAVRRSYREFVAAKEIVDTVVLNCVISALMTAGEPEAARAVFDRMKNMSREREGAAVGYVPRTWAKRRELSRTLQAIARQARAAAEKARTGGHGLDDTASVFQGMQDMISIAPDARSCAILVRHYATMAHVRGIAEVLDTMQEFNITHTEPIFTDLFRAFATHGSVRYSGWSEQRLLDTWDACVGLLEKGELVFGDRSKLMGIWALIAVRRNKGYNEAVEAYKILKDLWKGEEDLETVLMKPFPYDGDLLDVPTEARELLDNLRVEDEERDTRVT